MEHRKQLQWPPGPQDLLNHLDNGLLAPIYNAVALSAINLRRKLNQAGYITTPSLCQAEMIASIANSWEAILSGSRSAQGTALSFTEHRLIGSKKKYLLLSQCGFGLPYNDV